MHSAEQEMKKDKPERRDTGGLPVAHDATQPNAAHRTAENPGDHDEDPDAHDPDGENPEKR